MDWAGNVLSFNGKSWSTPRAIYPNGGGLYTVSCTKAKSEFCVAGGGTSGTPNASGPSSDIAGGLFTYRDGRWTSAPVTDQYYITGVSCASPTFCLAVDHDGGVLTYNGKSWSDSNGLSYAADGDGFSAVTCPKPGFCLAVTGGGLVEAYVNKSWHRTKVTTNDGAGGFAISCVPKTYTCTIADDTGRVITYNGFAWSSPKMIDTIKLPKSSQPALTSVSCPNTGFCVATDYFGNVILAKG